MKRTNTLNDQIDTGSALPKALVATHVNWAELVRSSFFMLKYDNTPVSKNSSRMCT
jgi:hypothetical protein